MANGGVFGPYTKLMFLGGAFFLGYLAMKNYGGLNKKGRKGPGRWHDIAPGDEGKWFYGNVANDEIAPGEGWKVTGQMNNRALTWHYGGQRPLGEI